MFCVGFGYGLQWVGVGVGHPISDNGVLQQIAFHKVIFMSHRAMEGIETVECGGPVQSGLTDFLFLFNIMFP